MKTTPRTSPTSFLAALAACALLGACAAGSGQATRASSSRRASTRRRSPTLEKAVSATIPPIYAARSEYFRVARLLVAQWLAQAEALRLAGDYDSAEALYRRIARYDPANARARAGLAQIESDKRHRTIVATAEKLAKEGKYRRGPGRAAPGARREPAAPRGPAAAAPDRRAPHEAGDHRRAAEDQQQQADLARAARRDAAQRVRRARARERHQLRLRQGPARPTCARRSWCATRPSRRRCASCCSPTSSSRRS